jgi:type VI protein secretion system component VasK
MIKVMNWIKIILAVLGLLLAVWVIFALIGIVSAILWIAFWVALLGAIGYGGYKLFLDKGRPAARLEDKTPTGMADMKNVDRELEEIKRKYLPK